MRSALSILGLVIAFAVVMAVMKKQVMPLAPKASPAASAPQNQADAVRQQLQQAMEQGAARASDAQP